MKPYGLSTLEWVGAVIGAVVAWAFLLLMIALAFIVEGEPPCNDFESDRVPTQQRCE